MDRTGKLAVRGATLSDNVFDPCEPRGLVVDAKYKNPLVEHHGDRFRNDDFYQAFTYTAALDAPAVLVYPRVDRDVDVTVRNGEEHIARLLSIDLASRSISDAREQLRCLVPVRQ